MMRFWCGWKGMLTGLGLTVLAAPLTGCATYGGGMTVVGGDGEVRYEDREHADGRTYGNLGIPPGHLPPPGECRIWYPGLPPGQQPPPGDCAELSRRLPPGAWLIEHPPHDREHVHVNVYDAERSGRRIEVRVYNASSGVFVRAELP